jgi:hypothetical protein
MNKKDLLEQLSHSISEKITILQADSADLQKDMAEDSKSSAGDKFETSREMAQQELAKLSTQISEQQRLKNLIESQSFEKSEFVKIGSLVQTDKGYFLVGIPIGKIRFEDKDIIGVGAAAPLGQLLLNKPSNCSIEFNQQSFQIEEII